MDTRIDTCTEQQKKPEEYLTYKTKHRYNTSHFVRAIETEHGRYIATNDFMHGAEDGDIA
jgi:hypothetical protein